MLKAFLEMYRWYHFISFYLSVLMPQDSDRAEVGTKGIWAPYMLSYDQTWNTPKDLYERLKRIRTNKKTKVVENRSILKNWWNLYGRFKSTVYESDLRFPFAIHLFLTNTLRQLKKKAYFGKMRNTTASSANGLILNLQRKWFYSFQKARSNQIAGKKHLE